jgi:hypothetical protein
MCNVRKPLNYFTKTLMQMNTCVIKIAIPHLQKRKDKAFKPTLNQEFVPYICTGPPTCIISPVCVGLGIIFIFPPNIYMCVLLSYPVSVYKRVLLTTIVYISKDKIKTIPYSIGIWFKETENLLVHFFVGIQFN